MVEFPHLSSSNMGMIWGLTNVYIRYGMSKQVVNDNIATLISSVQIIISTT